MEKVLIEVENEQGNEVITKFENNGCMIEVAQGEHFTADPQTVVLLVTIMPTLIVQIGKTIRELIDKGNVIKSVKIGGVEIKGFTYEETLELLKAIGDKKGKH